MFANTAAPPSRAPTATPAVGRAAALVPAAVGRRLVTACERELALLPAALVSELMAEVTLAPPAPPPAPPVPDVSLELRLEASDETEELRPDRAELTDEPAAAPLLVTELAPLVAPPPVGEVTVGVVVSWAYWERNVNLVGMYMLCKTSEGLPRLRRGG
jgi:hypothetical protein